MFEGRVGSMSLQYHTDVYICTLHVHLITILEGVTTYMSLRNVVAVLLLLDDSSGFVFSCVSEV